MKPFVAAFKRCATQSELPALEKALRHPAARLKALCRTIFSEAISQENCAES